MIKMNMQNVAKQYNFIIKEVDSAKYSGWFKGYCQHFSVNVIKGLLLKGFPGLLLRRQ